jgi:hypothetical protein
VTDKTLVPAAVTETITLKPGDVAVILPSAEDAEPILAHNIASIAETGYVSGGPDAAGIMLVLAFLDIIQFDEAALQAAMLRVAKQIHVGSGLSIVAH